MSKDWERAAWLGAACVIIGYYLNAHQHASSWLFWIVGNILIGFYCLNKKTYPPAVMSFVLVIINIYGYFKWFDF
tara:strand:+ start:71 stop:295 length:225 start_codon:yes stop_codon:yes gene_type:complete